MTGRLLDEARAFEIIAPHLSDERRQEIADKLASRLAGAPSGRAIPAGSAIVRTPGGDEQVVRLDHPEHDLAAHDPVVRYLKSIGYQEGELVRASSRLWAAVHSDREHREVAALTEKYLAVTWNRITAEAKPDA